MYCKKCNKQYKGTQKYCTTCGEALIEKKVNTKIILSAVIVALVAIIAVLATVALRLSSDEKESIKIEDDDFDRFTKDKTKNGDVSDEKAIDEAATEGDAPAEEAPAAEVMEESAASFGDFVKNEESINGNSYEISIHRTDDDFYGETDLTVIPEGLIGSDIYDYDQDGMDELLVLKHIGDGKLALVMYENDEGNVVESDKIYLDDSDIQMYAYAEGKIALYHNEDTIFVEDSNVVWLFADGVSLNILGLRYNDEQFEVVLKSHCAGSDLDENNMLMDDMAAYGVPRSAFNSLYGRKKFIYDYLKDITGICQIKTKHLIGIDEAMAWSENTSMTSMKLSEIKIKDLEVDEIEENDNDYILAGSDERYIDESELYGFDKEMCRLARNEIFARRGRIFDDESLREYFNSKDWYRGELDGDSFDESFLNDYELKNLDKIIAYEKAQGYR